MREAEADKMIIAQAGSPERVAEKWAAAGEW
jgi:hypothetical protein